MVEEFIEGADLTTDLAGAPWDRGRVVSFFTAMAEGLEALRAVQVVHRDLKPQNIRVRTDGTPVIIDFGLARHLSKSSLTRTAEGAQIGTPLYFAPEQFRATKREIDHRTDLFAVGVILHQALLGTHPFAKAQSTFSDLETAVCSGFVGSVEFEALPPKVEAGGQEAARSRAFQAAHQCRSSPRSPPEGGEVRRGAWHQFGNRSQKLALEQLEQSSGVGVIISPRDLSYAKALEYAPQYVATGAEFLVDQQFHVPAANVGELDTYPIASKRQAVSKLVQASEVDLLEVAAALRETNSALGASAVLAPAVVYEAGRSDIIDLNERLFTTSQAVAEELGVPCYATVFLGASATTSDSPTDVALDAATSLAADGWYYGFEFDAERIPSAATRVARYLRAGLTLATTGLPVLHGYVGPMAPLAMACGATGAAIGHSQNLWQFTRSRWEPTSPGGGGGDAPPRYFSHNLWGTLIYEDEWTLLPQNFREQVHTPTQFSSAVRTNPPFLPWDRWSANKHLVFTICKAVDNFANSSNDAELVLDSVCDHLAAAVSLHQAIFHALGFGLRDDTASYQAPWRAALQSIKTNHADDFEYLRLLS